ncbi:hypothetical protein ABNF97_12605 [Plantactinospora sp. B6F1]|uniref:hypothetical protein n=1 Tax=Plantactinospora sp. B6F1 TaxID=3158971 RepID=UPI0032D8B822
MFRRAGTDRAKRATGATGESAPKRRRGRGPAVVVTSVIALIICNIPVYRLVTDSADGGSVAFVLIVFGPGALVALSWLVRLVQWCLAARAPGTSVLVTPHLAQSPVPFDRGRTGIGTRRGLRSEARGYAVWLTWRGSDGVYWHQRVVWEPWLRNLTRPCQATVRRGPGAVTVIDVRDHGRLWPASFTLRRRPLAVRLTPFSKAHRLPEQTRLDFGSLAYLFLLLVIPGLVGVVDGDWMILGWWIGYVIALMAAVGTWFGIVPPGALPGGQRGRGSTPASRRIR